jgi:cation:H+ antiporter
VIAFAGTTFGILILIVGGTALVQGATQGGTRMGLSPMVVGLTIVGFGTSAPELVISIIAAMEGQTDLVFGNVVGSNIANLSLVLGVAAILAPIQIHGQLVRRELPLLLLGTTVIMIMALDDLLRGTPAMIDRSDALILLLLFCIFFYVTAVDMMKSEHTDQLMSDISSNPLIVTDWKVRYWWLLIVIGIGLLFVGGRMTVDSGVALAEQLGVSSTIIGLFALAIGTSLPELVTSVVAAMRGESDLAVGNVVGSNIFNGLFVLPISALVKAVEVPAGGIGDLVLSWVFAGLLIPVFFYRNARLGRPVGTFILLIYGAYFVIRLKA